MPAYFDYNATTPLDPRVTAIMLPYLEGPFGNASSIHRYGRAARAAIDVARAQVAELVNAQPDQVIFTSGGTESNNLAIKGLMACRPNSDLYIGATEHPCIIEPADYLNSLGRVVHTIAVNQQGIIGVADLAAIKPHSVVALMWANNETGVVQNIPELAECLQAKHCVLHTDAVQAAGKVAVDFAASNVDSMSLSAHKIYGPKGAGALVLRQGLDIAALQHGGAQEDGLRAGTENLPAIVGFGAAATLAKAEMTARNTQQLILRDTLQAAIGDWSDVTIFAAQSERLANTLQFSLAGYDGETLLMRLDQLGFAVSSGSACHSGSGKPSHVLLGMGISESIAQGAIRVSVGIQNTQAEVAEFITALASLRRI